MLERIAEQHKLIGEKIKKANTLNMFQAIPLAKEAANDTHTLMGELINYLAQKESAN